MVRPFFIILLLIIATALPVFGADEYRADSLFTSAGELYGEENFSGALEIYNGLIQNNYESASLYYNVGNCYIKENKFGFAILYYLKAEKLDPGDEEIQANLKFARQFMPTQMEGVEINPVTTFLDSLVEGLTLNNLAWISSILFILSIGLISYIVFMRTNNLGFRVPIYILILALVISTGLTTYKYRQDEGRITGVVVSDEVNVYSSPSENGDIEFVGGFGLVVQIDKQKDDFYLVIFENKRKGWIKSSDLGLI